MKGIVDRRYFKVYRINTENGEFINEFLADVWQDNQGIQCSPSTVKSRLVRDGKILFAKADSAFMSPLEFLKQQLEKSGLFKFEKVE